jgi:hypothetical protein
MGSSSSTSSSSPPNDPNCYTRNRMMRQQCLQTRPDNEYSVPKPYYTGATPSPTPQPAAYTGKTQMGCDYQGNVVECDESGRVIRVIKPNNR